MLEITPTDVRRVIEQTPDIEFRDAKVKKTIGNRYVVFNNQQKLVKAYANRQEAIEYCLTEGLCSKVEALKAMIV